VSVLIDRRQQARHRSTVNRQRFLRRHREHIRRAVSQAMGKRSITDIDQGEQVSIPGPDVTEPVFDHGPGGRRTTVHPGNREFLTGDRFPRPRGGGGGGGQGRASDRGQGMDDFAFHISRDEFLDFMFEDLALPNLVRRQLAGSDSTRPRRAGFSSSGTPNQIHIVRTLRAAHARRLATTGPLRARLNALCSELDQLENEGAGDAERAELVAHIEALRQRLDRIPFIDEFDVRYNLTVREPRPSSRAVMFCIMDVSGSMSQATKDMAKRFFILLHLFLRRHYEHTEVVFIRHHTSAREVDEEEFFHSRETGGTIVSSALRLMRGILSDRYPTSAWNIYAAQASDGDNWNDDSSICQRLLIDQLMPRIQHYSYVEITPREHQSLWHEYEQVRQSFPERFAMQQVVDATDIYPVFQRLFQREEP